MKNEETQFPDIEFSAARFDIVRLVAVGILPETSVFEPDKALSRFELATWAALAHGIEKGGEFPQPDVLAEAAVDAGLTSSLEGGATLGEVDQALFGGKLEVVEADRVPSKGEAATFISRNLTTSAPGRALLALREITEGPTGEITAVEERPIRDGGKAYFITVGAATLPAYAHIRVAGGASDLPLWKGRDVARTFVKQNEWIYLEAAPDVVSEEDAAAIIDDGRTEQKNAAGHGLFYTLFAAALVLAMLLFVSRRRGG